MLPVMRIPSTPSGPRPRRGLPTVAAALGTAALVAACMTGGGAYAPDRSIVPGTGEGDVTRVMGPPTSRYALPGGGTRLEYARGPYGRHTYMIDLDAGGRVTRSEQVLTEANFYRVTPGMSQQDVLLLLGRPGEVFGLARNRGVVWNWRYPTNDCLWFQVTITPEGTVRDAGRGPDPRCNGPDDRAVGM